MNKRFVFFYALISTTIIILALLIVNYMDKIKKIDKEEKLKEEIKNIEKFIQDNKIKKVIKVKMTETGKIAEMTINEYLKGANSGTLNLK